MCSALKIVVDLPMFSFFFCVYCERVLHFSIQWKPFFADRVWVQSTISTRHLTHNNYKNYKLVIIRTIFSFLRFQCTCRRGFHCTFQSSLAAQQWLKIFLCYRLNLENVLFLQEKIYIFFLFFFLLGNSVILLYQCCLILNQMSLEILEDCYVNGRSLLCTQLLVQ